MTTQTTRATITLRTAKAADVDGIVALSNTVYADMGGYTPGMVKGHLSTFPEGQFVVEYEGRIVGYSVSFMIDEETAFSPHGWEEITGGGYSSRHDPKGDWLYGMEVAVDPEMRRLRIGQRLYNARKELCEQLELKGIVFGGRIPGWARRRKQYPTAEAYLDAVLSRRITDGVIAFQRRMGFEPVGILHGYMEFDKASGGCATHMVWRNPYYREEARRDPRIQLTKEVVRVACVQFQQRRVESFEEFRKNIEYFVDVTSDYRCDFVVFPEYFTLQLLSLQEGEGRSPAQSVDALSQYTPQFTEALRDLAISYNINIIGGTHPTKSRAGDIYNVAYVFLRDGSVHAQEKLHPTPDERYWWGIRGGRGLGAIQTDCGPIGVMTCYDSEFPELARRLVDEGAKMLFVPFSTDTRQGYLRVRYCAQARAIEDQCYVVMAGNVGNLPGVENADIHYAQSAILTPCDFPFDRDGIAAECAENVETVAVADLDLSDLAWARSEGTVRNLRDRRFDLYAMRWRDA